MDDSPIARRKNEHVALALGQGAGFQSTRTLLDQVQLIHDPLPELSLEQVDTSVQLFGRSLRFPLVIAAMTGGSSQTGEINKQLASIAQERGYGFGLGSQRAMLAAPSLADSYRVRDVAPDVLLLGNIGVNQARDLPTTAVRKLVDEVGADAMCVHMNPAQEVVQPEGDHDFRGAIGTFARLVQELGCPVIAKETGCGVSLSAARRLRAAGVMHIDVSGAGGTSWVAIEAMRAQGTQQQVGELLREWGIPTAASLAMVRKARVETIIATGGISTGLDIARAIALGASVAGIARPVLQALSRDGRGGAVALLEAIEAQLRATMLLVGASNLRQLASTPRIIGPDLERWMASGPAEF
ncbi:MAG: type 2 isopentenyl-diphosphate Delta-isomerase [Deltaproteobacteria bacterium]|nr:type 2 isopentenyl-diphosphate Delta-isomerase [Deltaproteobacteria bacterium]